MDKEGAVMARRAYSGRTARLQRQIGISIAAALGLSFAAAGHADAAPNPEAVGDPVANRVWAGCELDLNTVNALKSALAQPPIAAGAVSFIVVHALTKANDGQPLTLTSGGGTTGPVICIPGRQTGAAIAIEKTTEEEDVPRSEDQGSGVASVDLLDISQALAARYSYGTPSKFEKRFCHTVANPATGEPGNPPPATNTDCFRIYAAPPGSTVDNPQPDRVWAGCTLSTTTAGLLRSAIQRGRNIDAANVEVSFALVYSLQHSNNGQALAGGGSTGPVICAAAGIENTTNSTDSPVANLLGTEESLVVRYRTNQPNGGSAVLETRFCQTVAGEVGNSPPETNTDCFRVYHSP
jgi:hypothetical protein